MIKQQQQQCIELIAKTNNTSPISEKKEEKEKTKKAVSAWYHQKENLQLFAELFANARAVSAWYRQPNTNASNAQLLGRAGISTAIQGLPLSILKIIEEFLFSPDKEPQPTITQQLITLALYQSYSYDPTIFKFTTNEELATADELTRTVARSMDILHSILYDVIEQPLTPKNTLPKFAQLTILMKFGYDTSRGQAVHYLVGKCVAAHWRVADSSISVDKRKLDRERARTYKNFLITECSEWAQSPQHVDSYAGKRYSYFLKETSTEHPEPSEPSEPSEPPQHSSTSTSVHAPSNSNNSSHAPSKCIIS